MASLRWPAIVVAALSITRAPAPRAAATVPSLEPPSDTITSPLQVRWRTHSAICADSLRVGMMTVSGVGMPS